MNSMKTNYIDDFKTTIQDCVWNDEKSAKLISQAREIVKFGDNEMVDEAFELTAKYSQHSASAKLVDIFVGGGGDIHNEYLLYNAAFFNNWVFIDELCKKGANPNLTKGFHQETALMAAGQNGNWQAAELLLKYGANINTTDRDGKSAYAYAIERGNSETAKQLVANGVNPTISR